MLPFFFLIFASEFNLKYLIIMKTKVLIVFLLFFLVSCTTNSLDEVSSSGSFSSFMMYNLSSNGTLNIMSEDIITRAMVNADNEESDQDNFDIYIDYPLVSG